MENVTPTTTSKPRIRIDYVDIAKFIGIILVILGHTTGNLDRPLYRVILYAFHMSLFFMVSGVVVKRSIHEYNWKHWLTFLRKNILCLVVPYLIWALIYCDFSFNNIPKILYASWETMGEIGTLTSLWFLPCLFVARIIVEFVMMLSSFFAKVNKHLFTFIGAVILFALGFIIPHPAETGLPWCFDISLVAAGFILLGYSIKLFLYKLYAKPVWSHILVMLISLVLFVGGIVMQGDEPALVLMCKADYGNIALFLINSITGSTAIMAVSMLITKLFESNRTNICNRFMLWVGRSTIGIYLIHKNFLQEVCIASLERWGVQLPNLGYAILATLVAFIYSCLIVFIIDRYVPQLFGKFPSKKIIVVKEEDFQEKQEQPQENQTQEAQSVENVAQ